MSGHICAFTSDCSDYGWLFCSCGRRRACPGCEKCAPVREQLGTLLQKLVGRRVLTEFQARTALDELETTVRGALAEPIAFNRTQGGTT